MTNILTFPDRYLTPKQRLAQAATELRLSLDELAAAWAACDQAIVLQHAPEVDVMMNQILLNRRIPPLVDV